MCQFHMAEQAENPSQAKQSALTCVISGTREQRHQLPRCMREHGCTIEEVTRDTNWQPQSSYSRQDSTRSQRTPKVQHREDSSLLSSFALDDPQSPCPRMTLSRLCRHTGRETSLHRAADVGQLKEKHPWEDLRGDWQERAGVRLSGLELSPLILTGNLTFSESLSIKQGLKIILTSPGY